MLIHYILMAASGLYSIAGILLWAKGGFKAPPFFVTAAAAAFAIALAADKLGIE
ncbi:MAG: hypothetical protein LBN26_04070 [Christensenellaceae bacterium]|jgi:hypothetical protein|nr:hypothetical protein [Christensenellaceae bacterium]